MGCGASGLSGQATTSPPPPPPPPYVRLPEDLSVPIITIESTHVPAVDELLERACDFAVALAGINNTINHLLLQARSATGALQGGFTVAVAPAPNTDQVAVELLMAKTGEPVDPQEVYDLNQGPVGSACIALAEAIEQLHDLLGRMAPRAGSGGSSENHSHNSGGIVLSLASNGTLRAATNPPPSEIVRFNKALTKARMALGSRYRLAVHLHKAQPHGAPGVRVRVLRNMEDRESEGHGSLTRSPSMGTPGTLMRTLSSTSAASGGGNSVDGSNGNSTRNRRASDGGGLSDPLTPNSRSRGASFMVPVTALDLGGGDAGRAVRRTLAAVLHEVNNLSALVQVAGADGVSIETPNSGTRGVQLLGLHALTDSAQQAALAGALATLNNSLFGLATEASLVGGPVSFSDCMRQVVQEVRSKVKVAGGMDALAKFKAQFNFRANPDLSFTFDLVVDLDPRWGLPQFPKCLSNVTRRAWQSLCELQREVNAVAGQLVLLRNMSERFLEQMRQRLSTIAEDAAAAQLPMAEAVAAARALAKNYKQFKTGMRVFTCLSQLIHLVIEEMMQAAQSAKAECEVSTNMAEGAAAPAPWAKPLPESRGPSMTNIVTLPSATSPEPGAEHGLRCGGAVSPDLVLEVSLRHTPLMEPSSGRPIAMSPVPITLLDSNDTLSTPMGGHPVAGSVPLPGGAFALALPLMAAPSEGAAGEAGAATRATPASSSSSPLRLENSRSLSRRLMSSSLKPTLGKKRQGSVTEVYAQAALAHLGFVRDLTGDNTLPDSPSQAWNPHPGANTAL